jgi:hypothetical protein
LPDKKRDFDHVHPWSKGLFVRSAESTSTQRFGVSVMAFSSPDSRSNGFKSAKGFINRDSDGFADRGA